MFVFVRHMPENSTTTSSYLAGRGAVFLWRRVVLQQCRRPIKRRVLTSRRYPCRFPNLTKRPILAIRYKRLVLRILARQSLVWICQPNVVNGLVTKTGGLSDLTDALPAIPGERKCFCGFDFSYGIQHVCADTCLHGLVSGARHIIAFIERIGV